MLGQTSRPWRRAAVAVALLTLAAGISARAEDVNDQGSNNGSGVAAPGAAAAKELPKEMPKDTLKERGLDAPPPLIFAPSSQPTADKFDLKPMGSRWRS